MDIYKNKKYRSGLGLFPNPETVSIFTGNKPIFFKLT